MPKYYFGHFVILVYNQLMAVYFIFGEDDYNIDLKLGELRSKLNPDFLSMSYKSMSAPDFDTLINILRSSPMMFGSSLSVIDIADYFFKDGYNFDDKEISQIETALNDNIDGNDIAFVVRSSYGDGKKIDSRRKLYKILTKFNTLEYQFPPTYKTAEIASWIKNRAKEKEIKINDDATEELIEQIGNNFMQLNSELDKLKLAAYPNKTVTKKMVEDNCISKEDLFNITNFLMRNEKDKAVLEFKQLLDKKHPLEILSALQTMIRQWIIIKSKSSVQEIMDITGIRSDYKIKLMKNDLKTVSLKDLVQLKENLFDVEYRIKAGKVLDMESEVEIAIIR